MLARRLLLILFLCILFTGCVQAQWRATGFGSKDGLQGFLFNKIFLDRDGRLWTVSTGGIQRFDGRSFRSIVTNAHGVKLLQLSNGRFMYTDLAGDLRELFLRNRLWNDSLLVHNPGQPGHVKDICEDSHHRVWLFTDNGLSFYQPGDTVLKTFPMKCPVNRLVPVHDGLLIGSEVGLFRFSENKISRVALPYTGVVLPGFEDAAGNIWLTVADSLLLSITPGGTVKRTVNLRKLLPKVVATTSPVNDGNGVSTYNKNVNGKDQE